MTDTDLISKSKFYRELDFIATAGSVTIVIIIAIILSIGIFEKNNMINEIFPHDLFFPHDLLMPIIGILLIPCVALYFMSFYFASLFNKGTEDLVEKGKADYCSGKSYDPGVEEKYLISRYRSGWKSAKEEDELRKPREM